MVSAHNGKVLDGINYIRSTIKYMQQCLTVGNDAKMASNIYVHPKSMYVP